MTRTGRQCSADQVRRDYTTEACAASAAQTRHPDAEVGDTLLLAGTTSYDSGGRVVELGKTFYDGDRYRFHATLVRERRQGGGKTG